MGVPVDKVTNEMNALLSRVQADHISMSTPTRGVLELYDKEGELAYGVNFKEGNINSIEVVRGNTVNIVKSESAIETTIDTILNSNFSKAEVR
jgi:hypothetical protein